MTTAVARAFNRLAPDYDRMFTDTVIGRAQRNAVWRLLQQIVQRGDYVLDLNCGTGEDAAFVARLGARVVAIDCAEEMIALASEKTASLDVRALTHDVQQLRTLRSERTFDLVLSNFSGLNCVEDLRQALEDIAAVLRPGGSLVLCMSTRMCLWESLWYLARGDSQKARRRWRGEAIAEVQSERVRVFYPSLRRIRKLAAPMFEIESIRAVGLCVPPSYLEFWARNQEKLIYMLEKIDEQIAGFPLLRAVGDHVLIHLSKVHS